MEDDLFIQSTEATPRLGFLIQDKVVDVELAHEWICYTQGREAGERISLDMMTLLERGENEWRFLRELGKHLENENLNQLQFAGEDLALNRSDVKLLSPIPEPRSFRDFYAFEDHVRTARANRGLDMVPEWYHFPVFYFSNHRSFRGDQEEIPKPTYSQALDFELEVGCIIGKRGKNISVEEAHQYIFGFAILNDWSIRDIQMQEVKVGLGPAKAKDFATSMGPAIVTLDELEDCRQGDHWRLEMKAYVNEIPLSQGNLGDLHFSFAQMIARASENCELVPGDVIGSGTVGSGCILELGPKVHRFLEPGDIVRLEVERLGQLTNTIK
nr:fumarylacetoacetate hydrolase family protein [Risungbinella massiliensis]